MSLPATFDPVRLVLGYADSQMECVRRNAPSGLSGRDRYVREVGPLNRSVVKGLRDLGLATSLSDAQIIDLLDRELLVKLMGLFGDKRVRENVSMFNMKSMAVAVGVVSKLRGGEYAGGSQAPNRSDGCGCEIPVESAGN